MLRLLEAQAYPVQSDLTKVIPIVVMMIAELLVEVRRKIHNELALCKIMPVSPVDLAPLPVPPLSGCRSAVVAGRVP